MASYKLSPAAEDDLYRIWLYGMETWGEDAADQYVQALLARFQKIADYPHQYPEVDDISLDSTSVKAIASTELAVMNSAYSLV